MVHSPRGRSVALACGLLAISIGTLPAADRTVACEAEVQSSKRGVAAQGNDLPPGMTLTQSDLDALSPGLSWYYNWAASTTRLDATGRMEFLPMAWGHAGDNAAVATWLAAHPATTTVLSANEPNLGSQANLTSSACADFIAATRAIAGGRRVIGPHLAASATTTTYRNEVNAALAGGLPASGIHVYDGSFGGFGYWAATWPHTGWPAGVSEPATVWVKEFNIGSSTATESQAIDFMIAAVDLMERDARVERYAWWKDRRKTGTRPASHFLLDQTRNGVLTPLGDAYVHMPVHDPALYYAVPGRLEFARYVAISGFAPPTTMNGNVAVVRTTDTQGRFDVADVDNGEFVEVNVDVPATGAYPITVRGRRLTAGSSVIAVVAGSVTLGSMTLTTAAGSYATSPVTTIALTAGRQRLRFQAVGTASQDTTLHWFEISAPAGSPVVPPSTGGAGVAPAPTPDPTPDLAPTPDPGATPSPGGASSVPGTSASTGGGSGGGCGLGTGLALLVGCRLAGMARRRR